MDRSWTQAERMNSRLTTFIFIRDGLVGISRPPPSFFRRAIYPLYVFLMYIHLICPCIPIICTSHNQRGVVNYELARRRIRQTEQHRHENKTLSMWGSRENFKIRKLESTSKVLRAADHWPLPCPHQSIQNHGPQGKHPPRPVPDHHYPHR